MKSTLRPITIAILACSLALPLSACGSDSSAPEGGTDTTSTATESESAEADNPAPPAENLLGSMSADEIEAKLQTVSVGGQPLTIPISHQKLTDVMRKQDHKLDAKVDSLIIEPEGCLTWTYGPDLIQEPSDLEFAVSGVTADQEITVGVEKVNYDMDKVRDELFSHASDCPEISVEDPDKGLKMRATEKAAPMVISPFPEGVMMDRNLIFDDETQSSYDYYGIDQANRLFLIVSSVSAKLPRDEFEALVADIISQLNTQ